MLTIYCYHRRGFFGNICGADDTFCLGYIYCTDPSGNLAAGTCGGLGSYCQVRCPCRRRRGHFELTSRLDRIPISLPSKPSSMPRAPQATATLRLPSATSESPLAAIALATPTLYVSFVSSLNTRSLPPPTGLRRRTRLHRWSLCRHRRSLPASTYSSKHRPSWSLPPLPDRLQAPRIPTRIRVHRHRLQLGAVWSLRE
jgi:hypothetical protein